LEGAVYILCALTALACSSLLLRGYLRNGVRLLLWCGIFFLAMAIENAILFVDLRIVPDVDLTLIRLAVPLVGVALLLYGLVWDVR
jgi:hypothetical protein